MKSVYLFTILKVCLLSQVTLAQEAIYLKVTDNTLPAITGPVTVTKFANQIQLTSVQFGEKLPLTRSAGGVAISGGPVVTPITITKSVDVSSAKLMQVLGTPRALDAIEINFVRGGEAASVYYKIELTNVYVVNHSISLAPNCPNGCSGLAESFALDYGSIRVTTYHQLGDGQVVADTPSYTYPR